MPVPRSSSPISKRRLLREEAHDAIRDAILSGAFAPGEQLDDQQLQEWLGVSRTPVRDALNALAIEGLVETAAQSYTRVIKPDPAELRPAVQALGALMGGVLRVTEPTLAPEIRAHLVDIIDIAAREHPTREPGTHLRTMLEVHELLNAQCQNPVLQHVSGDALTSLGFRLRATPSTQLFSPETLTQGYQALRTGLVESRPQLASLALESLHLITPGRR